MPEAFLLDLDLGLVERRPIGGRALQSGDACRGLLFEHGEVAPVAARVEDVLPTIDAVCDREHSPLEDRSRRRAHGRTPSGGLKTSR